VKHRLPGRRTEGWDVNAGAEEKAGDTMTGSSNLGVAGWSVPPGTHVYGFFRGKGERDQLVFPFLRHGDQLDIVLSREIYPERGDSSVPDMMCWRAGTTSHPAS
jgi:hypothetical protein